MKYKFSKKISAFRLLSFSDKLDLISFVAFCLVIIDCAISGGGRWLMIGPLSARMVLGFLSFTCAIPVMLKKIKQLLKNPMVISLMAFVLFLGISALIGISRHNNLDVLVSDLKGFLWLFLVPVAIAVIGDRERLHIVMKCIVVGATIQAILIIGLDIFSIYFKSSYTALHSKLIQLQISFLDNITDSMFRVFFKSCPYLIVGCVCMVYYQIIGTRFKWSYCLCTAVCLNAILLSFTRSLYGATGITIVFVVVLYLVFNIRKWKALLLHMSVSLLLFAAFIAMQQYAFKANYINFAISRTLLYDIPLDQQQSDQPEQVEQGKQEGQAGQTKQPGQIEQPEQPQQPVQSKQPDQQQYIDRTKLSDNVTRPIILTQLKDNIMKNPIFGNGLGATIDFRKDGYVEYFYYDVTNKMGFLGLILYAFPVGYMVYILIRQWRKRDKQLVLLRITWLCGLLSMLTISYFNPYMNAALGISCYSVAIGCFHLNTNENNLNKSFRGIAKKSLNINMGK